MVDKVALVVGATGLVGRELVSALMESPEWKLVYGLARAPDNDDDHRPNRGKYQFVGCDLLDRGDTMEKLTQLEGKATHVFWVTWASKFQLETQECCEQNRAMLSNALDALMDSSSLKHVSLQTGIKHYVSFGGQDSCSGDSWSCSYPDEESPRVGEGTNFYYALEDLLRDRLSVRVRWSVHRPGLLLGSSRRTHFNVVGSLCVYGAICTHKGFPFLFGGDRRCWEEPYMDASDARLVARQHIWWASSKEHDHTTFNAVNVSPFAWKEIWPALAKALGADDGGFAEELRYGPMMGTKDTEAVWDEIVETRGLRRTRLDELANWWFLDSMFRFPGKEKLMVRRPTRAQRLGFTHTYSAAESILYWVGRMREERLIP